MESEYFLTDKNGQRIDNLQKYYDENPEILKKHIERLNENNNWEPSESLFNPEKVKLLIEIHDVGVFRKACEKFYLDWLNEINTHSANENFLLEQKEKAQDFIDESKIEIAYRPDNVVIMENGNYLISTMESLQNKINRFLSRLERERAKGNPTGGRTKKRGENRILAYNNNIENALKKIELILKDVNTLLFENSTSDQWKQILNLETLTTPIIVKNGIALNGLSKFFEALSIIGVFEKQWQTKLSLLNAFKHTTEYVTADQFKRALNDGKSNGTKIDRDLEIIFIGFKNGTDIDKELNELLSRPPKHKF